jgi:LacI family transcriptional regulator
MANIRDIARLSGVSASTVSNIINGRYSIVKPQTRDRVLAAMRDLNYKPSPLFHGRDVPHAMTIGVAFTHVDNYVMLILEGILTFVEKSGWNVTTINPGAWEDLHRSLRMYCDGRIDALLVIDPATYVRLAEALEDRNLPCVIVNDESEHSFGSTVGVDVEAAAAKLVDYLIELGHVRIGIIRGVPHMEGVDRRYNGYLRSLASHGIEADPELIRPGVYREDAGHRLAAELLSLPPDRRPTALFCGNDYIAMGAIRACTEAGLAVPKDISIVGFDDTAAALELHPALTTIRRPLKQIGIDAADIAVRRVIALAGATPPTELEHRLLPTELVVRDSTARPPKA